MEDPRKLPGWLATRGRPIDSQMDGTPHYMGLKTNTPIRADALGATECETVPFTTVTTTASWLGKSSPSARRIRAAGH
jgi:hypothetical protein